MSAHRDSVAYEDEHVHQVYEQIASHFSSTRYKPWPIVERFLTGLPDGAVGLDIGCGNGKYLAVNPNVYIVASDRSTNLAKIATRHQPHSAIVADTLSLPHPPAAFDFAISIAVIHHLSTPERRVEATRAILEQLKADGRALVYVWALEQKDSRRGWDEGHEQDVMVPWVMNKNQPKRKKGAAPEQTDAVPAEAPQTFHRYYHLYRKGELEHDIELAGGDIVEAGYEKDNWWAIMKPKAS
ncbi:trna (uracil-5-)-methyltransferase trm9 [Diplodia corticola]|uniref:Trna (Uracil-5-)-methyltransferase trm9 n=1 Tax=Diplodia corticola TaxID=236234 RepID=A0A1J9QV25_9PEZI|nr:trna (uracil-5-)-methyltransferase trm9 [Diplodia corticola]OJD31826.1 trna (uracil-5-)-methyltransferase trm9 [Diplodia corticola]